MDPKQPQRVMKFYYFPPGARSDTWMADGLLFEVAVCGICDAEIWVEGGRQWARAALASHLDGYPPDCCANRPKPREVPSPPTEGSRSAEEFRGAAKPTIYGELPVAPPLAEPFALPRNAEEARRSAFRDRRARLLDLLAIPPTFEEGAQRLFTHDLPRLRERLAVELDAFLAETPAPTSHDLAAWMKSWDERADQLAAERDAARESLEAARRAFEREHKHQGAWWWSERHDKVLSERNRVVAALEKAIDERDAAQGDLGVARTNADYWRREHDERTKELAELKARRGPVWSAIDRVLAPFGVKNGMEGLVDFVNRHEYQADTLRDLGLPPGKAGFDALVASHQQLTAIDKALSADTGSDDTQDQLDRIEARVNDIGVRIGYRFSAPPIGEPS